MMVWKTINQCMDICFPPKSSRNISTKTRTIHTAVMKYKCPAVAYARTQERNTCTKWAHETWMEAKLIPFEVAIKLVYIFERWRKLSNRPYQWYRWFTSYCGKGSWSFLIRPSTFHVLFHHDGIRVCPHEFALLVTGKGMNSPPWGRSLPDPWRWILDSLCQTPLKTSESYKSSTCRFSSASATNFSSTENVLFVSKSTRWYNMTIHLVNISVEAW